MTHADGFGAWWNQYGSPDIELCVDRAKQLGPHGFVIVKAGYPVMQKAFQDAGVRTGVERYVYPGQPLVEASYIAAGIDRGAQFAVINAEIEWEALPRAPMEALIAAIRDRCPNIELFASVDTRGNRMNMPFQQVLAEHIAGWMPEIYPKAFGQSTHAAFEASLAGKDFKGIPVYPTIQTYDDVGALVVSNQLEEVRARGLPGCQAYTVGHATDEEWAVFVAGIPQEGDDDPMLKALMYVAGAFAFIGADIHQGFQPNKAVCDEILGLMGDGPIAVVATRQHGEGLLLYAQGEALRGHTLNEQATMEVRYICKTRPVLPP